MRILFLALLLIALPCSAEKPIKISKIPTALQGSTLLAVGTNGAVSSVPLSKRNAKITPPTQYARLYTVKDGKVNGAIVGPECKGKKKGKCKTQNGVRLSVKAGGKIRLSKNETGGVIAARVQNKKQLNKWFQKGVTTSLDALGASLSSYGLASESTLASLGRGIRTRTIESIDEDNDGLVDAIDSDDDGDGILDNYDSDSDEPEKPVPTNDSIVDVTFPVFSNFKVSMESTVNLHATGLDKTGVDNLMSSIQTLAIGVSGSSSDTTELDCTGLSYCSAGGTGKKLEGMLDFPGTAGGTLDTDGDGLGEITRGTTGDFQLLTGATSSTIGAGDTMVQIVNEGTSSETVVPGMLNFVFTSTPALKSVAVNGGAATTIDYFSNPVKGSGSSCISVPATGQVELELTGWRPQRVGIESAGEGEYVDIGGSLITIDIPNAPCTLSGGGGCSGTGPGNCVMGAYNADSDTNLSVQTNGIDDNKGDVDSDSANTYTFKVNLSSCLAGASSGTIPWNAGESLFVDLQFRSDVGDNAAQKFCVKRADS